MKAKAQGIPVNAEATVPLLNDSGDKPHSDIYNTEFSQQLKSGVFWSMTAVTAFLVLRVNFYIATIFDQLLFTARMQAPRSALVMANSYTGQSRNSCAFQGASVMERDSCHCTCGTTARLVFFVAMNFPSFRRAAVYIQDPGAAQRARHGKLMGHNEV